MVTNIPIQTSLLTVRARET